MMYVGGNRVVFHHLPKCGGTSVLEPCGLVILYRMQDFHPSHVSGYGSAPSRSRRNLDKKGNAGVQRKQLLCFLFDDVRCIAGHVPFCETAYDLFKERYNFITTLREPVSLIISLFFYDATSSEDRWRFDGSIEAFLETPRAALFGTAYAHFFSGLPPDCDPQSRAVIERAKANLGRFTVSEWSTTWPTSSAGFATASASDCASAIGIRPAWRR